MNRKSWNAVKKIKVKNSRIFPYNIHKKRHYQKTIKYRFHLEKCIDFAEKFRIDTAYASIKVFAKKDVQKKTLQVLTNWLDALEFEFQRNPLEIKTRFHLWMEQFPSFFFHLFFKKIVNQHLFSLQIHKLN